MLRPLWQFIPKESIIRVKVPADTQSRRLTGQKQLSETVITLNELFAKIAQSILPERSVAGGGGGDGLTQIGPDHSRYCYCDHRSLRIQTPNHCNRLLTAESAIQSETDPSLCSLLVRAPAPAP